MAALSGYDAFISYGREHDADLAPRLQEELQRFAKPWYKIRSLRVFCDTANLAAGPALQTAIEEALDASRWFILLASADAAESDYVNWEVSWWLTHRSADRLLIIATSPGLAWDKQRQDWAAGAPVPPALRGAFSSEPLWVDLSDLQLDGHKPVISMKNIAALASTIQGVPLDTLVGEHLREHRRAMRLAKSAIVSLSLLAGLASIAAAFAFQQRATAQSERDDAIFGQITAETRSLPATNVSLAAQLDIVAYRMRSTPDVYDNLLSMADSPLSTPLIGDAGPVYSVAFSPNSRILATGTDYGQVQLWNVANPAHPVRLGRPLASQPPATKNSGPIDIIYSVAFNPDGKLVAAGSDSGEITLWDIANLRHPKAIQLRAASPGVGINSVAFSPNGDLLGSGASNGTIQAWDLVGPSGLVPLGSAVQTGDGPIYSVAFSPAGPMMASGGNDGNIRLWNVTTQSGITAAGPPMRQGKFRVNSLAFYPNGTILASGSSDLNIRLWLVSNPRSPVLFSTALSGVNPVDAVSFTPDGRILASSDGSEIQLWSISVKGLLKLGQPLTGDTGPIRTMAFSPDGHLLATGSVDRTIRLWTLPHGLLVGHSSVRSIAFSPVGDLVAVGCDNGTIQLWKLPGSTRPVPVGAAVPDSGNSSIATVAFSRDGHVLADGSRNGVIQLWTVSATTGLAPLGQPILPDLGQINSVAFSPNSDLLASGSSDGAIELWNVSSPARPEAEAPAAGNGGHGVIESVAFSRDGKTLADGTNDGSLQLWNVTDPAHIVSDSSTSTIGGDETIATVAFDPHGRILATAGEGDAIQLWNVSDPKAPVMVGHQMTATDFVFSVAFSPDGRTLAAGSTNGVVSLWDVATPARASALGELPLTNGSLDSISSVSFSPHGHVLAFGSFDDAVRIVPTSATEAIRTICAAIPGVLSKSLWQQYITGLPYSPPCED